MKKIDLPKELYEEREILSQELRNLNTPASAIEFSDSFARFVEKWRAATAPTECDKEGCCGRPQDCGKDECCGDPESCTKEQCSTE